VGCILAPLRGFWRIAAKAVVEVVGTIRHDLKSRPFKARNQGGSRFSIEVVAEKVGHMAGGA
jgi:hypothetical protein